MYDNFETDFEQAVKKWNADRNNSECQINIQNLQDLYDLETINKLFKKIEEHNNKDKQHEDLQHEDLFEILGVIKQVEELKKNLKELIKKHEQKSINDKKFYQEHFKLMVKLYSLPQCCSYITHEYTKNRVSDGFKAYDIDGLIKWLVNKNTMPTQEPPSPELLSFIKLLRPDCELQADEYPHNIKVYSEYKSIIFKEWTEIANKYKDLKLDEKDENNYYFEKFCALIWQIMLFLITKKNLTTHKQEFEEKLELITNKKAKQYNTEQQFLDFIQEQVSNNPKALNV